VKLKSEMFMIVPPLNKWDDERTALNLGISTIGKTAGEAWRRHTQGNPDKVQAWFDRGYRLRRVEVKLLPEPPPPLTLKGTDE
jgi:hypothetical protein